MNKTIVLDFAQKAGFGAIARVRDGKKLMHFAEMIVAWKAEVDAATCTAIADKFKEAETDFRDGQMDGAYQCAEAILGGNNEANRP